MWLGTPSQVGNFKTQTGATFPLLLCGTRCIGATGICATSGSNCSNFDLLYGPYDNYIVIDTQGIVRYHAANIYAHGNRYHLQEIRAAVDTLLPSVVDVGDPPSQNRPAGLTLNVAPNPSRSSVAIEIVNPGEARRAARVTVHDLTGRIVATPLEGYASPGLTRGWGDGRTAAGGRSTPGVYLVRARLGSTVLARRVVWLR